MKDVGFRVLEFRVDLGLEFRVVFGSAGFECRFYGWWFAVENKRLGFLESSNIVLQVFFTSLLSCGHDDKPKHATCEHLSGFP